MKDPFEALDQLYRKVLVGAALEGDTQDYICHLHPASPDHGGSGAASSEPAVPLDVQGKGQPSPSPVRPATPPVAPAPWRGGARDLVLLRLTVTHVMASRALSVDTEFRAKEKYREVLEGLLRSSDLDSQLICTFQNSDKLLSHVTAKCLAWLLYFQLREQMTLSNSWIAFCQKSLSEYSESDKVVVHCLWTLTAVIKEIFKGTGSQKSDLLKQFLAPLDAPFGVFYDSFFSRRLESPPDARDIANSLLGVLELLELLVASRAHGDLHCTCQRIVFLKPSRVLRAATWPVRAFARRKLVLFLKRCLLWKAGEDLCRGAVAGPAPPDRHLDGDVAALADAVLQAVDAGLLGMLSGHGEHSCFAGGEVQPACERPPGPDHVILRATSLLILKSLEIKFENCASAEEMKGALQRHMSELLAFLQPRLQPAVQAHHPCEWLSRVFMEQDDDLLEAARASLGIYLKLTRKHEAAQNVAREGEAWSRHTHENGYNPHCVFLFLLKNVGFDSTVLLDFLISSETCFLEYFVRYLKLLPQDWDAFLTVCKHFDAAGCTDSMNTCGRTSSPVQDAGSSRCRAESGPPLAALGRRGGTPACVPRADPPNRAAVSRGSLVDYDPSDDSEAESPDVCSARSKQTPAPREATGETRDVVGTRRGRKEGSLELPPGPVVPEEADTPLSVACEVGTFHRTAKCFQELQGAVSRLQRKNLFPYNPSALLRLLKRVEAIGNKSTSPF